MENKANKHSVATALHRKANKKDIDEEFKKLIRNSEFDQIIQLLENKASLDDIERLEVQFDEQVKRQTIDELKSQIQTLAKKEDLESVIEKQSDIDKNINENILSNLHSQLSSLADSFSEQFELLREDIYEKLSNKIDSTAMMEVSTKISKKADNDKVTTLIAQNKNNIIDILENYKKEFRSIQDLFEKNYRSKPGK